MNLHLEALVDAETWAGSGAGRRRRESLRLTLREVAGAVGVDASTLWRWEHGVARPRRAAALRWMAALEESTERGGDHGG